MVTQASNRGPAFGVAGHASARLDPDAVLHAIAGVDGDRRARREARGDLDLRLAAVTDLHRDRASVCVCVPVRDAARGPSRPRSGRRRSGLPGDRS